MVRNAANYPLEDVKLTLQSTSPYIQDIRDNTITVTRLEKNNGGLPGFYDTCDTRFGTNQNNQANGTRCPSNDHFVFTVVPPAGVTAPAWPRSSLVLHPHGAGAGQGGSRLRSRRRRTDPGYRGGADLPRSPTTSTSRRSPWPPTSRRPSRPSPPTRTSSPPSGPRTRATTWPSWTAITARSTTPTIPTGTTPIRATSASSEPGSTTPSTTGTCTLRTAPAICEDGTCPDGGRSVNVLSA